MTEENENTPAEEVQAEEEDPLGTLMSWDDAVAQSGEYEPRSSSDREHQPDEEEQPDTGSDAVEEDSEAPEGEDDGYSQEYLVAQAEQAGIPNAAELAKAGVLEDQIRFYAALAAEAQANQVQEPQPEVEPTQSVEPIDLGLDDLDIDPELQEKLKGAFDALTGKIAELQSKVSNPVDPYDSADSQAYTQQLLEREQAEAFDHYAAQWGDVIGSGPTTRLNDREAINARAQILQQMDILGSGYAQQGLNIPSEKELMGHAINLLFAENIQKQTTKEISEKSRKQVFTQRPKARATQAPTDPRSAAIDAVGAKLDKLRSNGKLSESFM